MKCYKPIPLNGKNNEYFIYLSKKEYSELIEIKKDLEEHQIKIHDLININLENILKVDYQDYDKYNKTDSNILIFDTNRHYLQII
jgi:hypothetical protein